MSTRTQVLSILSDGAFHSGTDMGQRLGISRAAINKAIQQLIDYGLEIHRVSGKGYRMPDVMAPLDEKKIRQGLKQGPNSLSCDIEIHDELPSTSEHLLRRETTPTSRTSVCLAEAQSLGRGRRGRAWVASPYSNIMMSMSWRFPAGLGGLSGLSLAAGVAVVEALEECSVEGVGLKWPNDILWNQKKLGGVLMDLQGEIDGPCFIVLGLGLNVYMQENYANDIEAPWVDLYQVLEELPDRNVLIAHLVNKLGAMFQTFEREGFESYRARWEDLHVYHGQQVKLLLANGEVHGEVHGVDAQGALRLRDQTGTMQIFHSGEISLRPVS